MVIVKTSQIIKPSEPTPNQIMYISECDQIRALTHTPTVYFYRPTTESAKGATDILKDSLSKALVIFYPLAGRLHWIGGGRVELHCNSMGALLLEAESQLKIDDFGDFRPTTEIRALIPSVDYATTRIHEIPLLLVQLTKFACGGLGLGLGMSHVVVDGLSALYFVREWTKIARGGKPEDVPFFDRTVLQPKEPLASPTLKHSVLRRPPLLIGHSGDLEERKKPTTTTMLKVSKDRAEKLKNKANQGLETESNSNPRGFSKYESISAHVWRCASKARRHTSKQETAFYVIVDFRNILNPPLPPRYIGNGILNMPAITTAGELLSKPLAYAAGKIREAIKMVTEEYVNSFLVCIKNIPDVSLYRNFHSANCSHGSFYGNPNLTITSWIGLPTYGADFGWGKEIFMGTGGLGYDGLGLLLPTADGDGSFFIPLSLQVEHMDAFQKYFYEEII